MDKREIYRLLYHNEIAIIITRVCAHQPPLPVDTKHQILKHTIRSKQHQKSISSIDPFKLDDIEKKKNTFANQR